MSDNRGGQIEPTQISLNQLVPESAVREVKVEPEAVAVQRLQNEAAKESDDHKKYMRIVTICATIAIGITIFLIFAFIAGGLNDDTKKIIVATLGAGLAGVIGVAVGKKI